MKFHQLFLIFASVLLAAPANAVEQPSIVWSIVNRNRILSDEAEEQRYLVTLKNYLGRAAKAAACDPRRFKDSRPIRTTDLSTCRTKSQYPAPTNRQFRTRWNPVTYAYDSGYIARDRSAEVREVRLGLTAGSARERTTIGHSVCDWWIDANKVATRASCQGFLTPVTLGEHQIAVDIVRGDQQAQRIPQTGAQEISVNDYLIAVLGDSFGSGEGNPHTFIVGEGGNYLRNRPAMWLDPPCHRSLFSSSGLLSAYLADKFQHASFTLATFACSGAETSEGVLDPYYGRETAKQLQAEWWNTGGNMDTSTTAEQFKGFTRAMIGQPAHFNTAQTPAPRDISSQLQQLQALLCAPGKPCRAPDAIVIYIGVNDIGFTNVVTKLVTGCKPKACEEAVGQGIKSGLDVVESNLSKISAELKRRGLMPASPSNVLLVTYPNPLTYQVKKRILYCDWRKASIAGGENFLGVAGTFLAIGIRKASAEWAEHRLLSPLNDTLRRSAADLGWTVVETQQTALGHGFCAPGRWFQIYPESQEKQGLIPTDFVPNPDGSGRKSGGIPSGAMHPNIFGHLNVEAKISEKVQTLFNLNGAP
ncbi:hypothetical protein ACFSQT_22465 [Mesorhizobium calcicola]|uniref:SGNH hydrolase-type esterase domain-containing protein n=1 Tax=Mesorhizobium calcicola TaxID=1300310 RepID=A0ABW4WJM0_9HYPH